MKRSFTALLLAFCLVMALCPLLVVPASAAAKITETVNLSRPEKNMSGSGYYWNNREDTLTLDGLYIDTDSEFGLRIPQNATVILKGKNVISASRAALTIPGNVTFKGDGSLTLISDDMGMYFYSTDDSTTARFLSGSYTITAGKIGIYSTSTSVSLVNGSYDISVASPEGFAIDGREIKLYGGKMTMNNSVHTSVSLEIRALDLTVSSAKAALTSDKTLVLNDVSIKTGAAATALAKAESYNGENCIATKSTAKNLGSSVIFGESVPMFVDIAIVIVLLLAITAGVAVPFIRSYKKGKEARAALEAVLADNKPAKKN